MRARVQAYLALRRAFGTRLEIPGLLLQGFARFADRAAPGSPLTLDLALRWARKSRGAPQTGVARRLQHLRPFAQHLRAADGTSELIPMRLVSPVRRRPQPQIPSDEQLRAVLSAASCLSPKGGLRPHTIPTYLALLLCTGMRPSEPLRLGREDVNLGDGILTVRQTKFSKSRFILLHPSASQALREYVRVRDRHVPEPRCGAFFLMDGGRPLRRQAAAWAFRYACRRVGLRLTRRKHLRLYDLRHAFVCRRIL